MKNSRPAVRPQNRRQTENGRKAGGKQRESREGTDREQAKPGKSLQRAPDPDSTKTGGAAKCGAAGVWSL